MKNILIVLLFFAIGSFVPAFADYHPVELMESVDVANLPQTLQLKLQKDLWISDVEKIDKGSIIKGQVKKFRPTRRLERDSSLVFVPVSYIKMSVDNVPEEVLLDTYSKTKVRRARHFDKKVVTANTVGTALSCLPPFNVIVPVVQFCIGFVKHESNEHPFKGGVRALVECWPICYCLKGKEIPLEQGAIVEISLHDKYFAKKSEAL